MTALVVATDQGELDLMRDDHNEQDEAVLEEGNVQVVQAKLVTGETESEMFQRVTDAIVAKSSAATAVEMVEDDKADTKKKYLVGVCSVLVLVAIVVGVTIGMAGNSDSGGGAASTSTATSSFNDTCLLLNLPDFIALDEQQQQDDPVLVQVPQTLCYERTPYQGYSKSCDTPQLTSASTTIMIQSHLWYVPTADFALVNAGQIGSDICQGVLTETMARQMFPYDNDIVVMTISGTDVLEALEEGLQYLSEAFEKGINSAGGYPYAAGLRYDINMTADFGNRVSNVEVNPQLASSEWIPINLSANYTMTTNGWLAIGGDGYEILEQVYVDSGGQQIGALTRDAFVEYLQDLDNKTLVVPPQSFFSTQNYIHNSDLFNTSGG